MTEEIIDFTDYEGLAQDVPQLRRGQLWCHKCDFTMKWNSANGLRNGWPLHCGETMSIDSLDERKAASDDQR